MEEENGMAADAVAVGVQAVVLIGLQLEGQLPPAISGLASIGARAAAAQRFPLEILISTCAQTQRTRLRLPCRPQRLRAL